MNSLFKNSIGVFDLLFPRTCLVCRRVIASDTLCNTCKFPDTVDESGPRCYACFAALPLPARHHLCLVCQYCPLRFGCLRYLWLYTQEVRDIIRSMKYHPSRKLSVLLAEELGKKAPSLFEEADWDLIVGIPTRRKSFRKRGFHPTLTLANQVKRAIHHGPTRFKERTLLTTSQKPRPQATVPIASRRKNVRGCFSIRNTLKLDGLSVLLVDDVVTSGATCLEAVMTLTRAGVSRVDVLALACSPSFYRSHFTRRKKGHTKGNKHQGVN